MRPDFSLIWGADNAPFTPIEASDYTAGWVFRTGAPPRRVNFDYFQNLSDQRTAWLGAQMLLAVGHEWQDDVTYDAYAITRSPVDGQLYRSLVGSNLDNEPSVSGSQWVLGVAPGAPATVLTSGIAGSASNLKISTTGLSALVTVTADSICLKNSANEQVVINAVSVTPSLAASGVDGLDAASSAINTWYSVWVIWNPTTSDVAGLLSTSTASPTMPSGYTHKARVGWVRSDSNASNKYPLSMVQAGDEVQYKVVAGTNVTILPGIASGSQGTVGSVGVLVPGISNLVPPTASAIFARSYVSPTSTLQLSPGPIMSLAAGSPCFTVSTSTTNLNLDAEFIFEAPNQLYYAGNGSVPNCTASCRGWRDNL